ncbi:M23 family metallopeptidase [Arthrobacter jiangjiafuii]|uniref:M23 family metallopeptidase n=1 Tax=Arthrobacter jiangjiafuii TaxID=2817475 RepID=A0A975M336_9MICC|nr:M23 family metallopeptidase [Arthrobacter jiangjiafuii]MBP3043491.1 M23 family metallopeptidase [Arthrobacter jiangjiafuii]QWC09012.1 M23 family metallopeptidase [Arthrobacter jiangjiafuii]
MTAVQTRLGQHRIGAAGPAARTAALLRWPVTAATMVLAVAALTWQVLPEMSPALDRAGALASFLVLLLTILMLVLQRTLRGRKRPPVVMEPPVSGSWTAVSSPSSSVPSHGTHIFGQTWAIDLLVTGPEPRPFPLTGGFRPASSFPAFGLPVTAGTRGTVVSVRDTAPDHRSRNSWSALPVLFLESLVRGIPGSRHVFGNLIVIATDDGGYLAYAHLKQGSARVRPGDRVGPETLIARCGNSGSSSEPHLHLQAMDRPRPTFALGLPLAFHRGGEPVALPARGGVLEP